MFNRVIDADFDERTVACRRSDGKRYTIAEDEPDFSVETIYWTKAGAPHSASMP